MHPPLFRKLILSRFLSVQAGAVDLTNPCFLVGRNGSGKSNIVAAFAFLADAMQVQLQGALDRRGGIAAVRNRSSARSRPPNMGIAVEMGEIGHGVTRGRYALEIVSKTDGRFFVKREQCSIDRRGGRVWFDRDEEAPVRTNVTGVNPVVDPGALVLPLIGGDERFAPMVQCLSGVRVHAIDPKRLREFQDPEAPNGLLSDGRNAASILRDLDVREREEINRFLSRAVPHTTSVQPKKHGNKLSLAFEQDWGKQESVPFEGFSMSDGTLRIVGLLAAVFQKPTPTLLVIEEPEATIHVGAIGVLLDLIRHAARRMSVVITTHSAEVFDSEWIEPEHIRLVDWTKGMTRVMPLAENTKAIMRNDLMGAGELMRSNALDGAQVFDEEIHQPKFFEDLA